MMLTRAFFSSRRGLGAAGLCTLLFGSPALAQETARLTADIDFARGLAVRFGYVDMAEEVITTLEAEELPDELEEKLGLAKCDIYASGAGREPDAEKRLELYDKAVASYLEFIEKNPFSALLSEAERSYVDFANRYASALERSLEESVGEDAEAKREKIRSVLENGLERTGDLIELLEDPDLPTVKKNEKYSLMLSRGQMLLTLASVSAEGTFFYNQAEETLESLAFDAGELTGWGLRAYLELGKVKFAQGKYLEATDFLEFVVDTVVPESETGRSNAGWGDLSADERARRWQLAEMGSAPLIDAYRNAGEVEASCKWALHVFNTWRREGFSLGPLGYLSLISSARALLESGGFVGGQLGEYEWFPTLEEMNKAGFRGRRDSRSALDLALSIGQQVNSENRGNVLQLYAQKLISEVIDRPGVQVDPEVLFEAAQGEYYSKNYADAHAAFKRVMRAIGPLDDARRQEYGSRVMWHIGSSLDRMGRPLEAAMAFREGATTWKSDPEFGPKNAKGYYEAISTARRAAPDDETFASMRSEAENLRLELQEEGDTGDILFRQGDRAYSAGDYEEARKKYLEVEPSQRVYEEAIAKAALCLYKQKDTDGAAEEFRSYIEDFITDARNALPPGDTSKLAARNKARAQATFYLGRMAFDAMDFDEAIRWMAGYHEKFPAQTDYGPPALYMVVLAQLAKKDLEAAKATQAQMTEHFASHTRTGSAALKIFGVLKAEMAKAEAAGDAEAARGLKQQMLEYLHLGNSLTSPPSFANLRTESILCIELELWPEGEQVLANMLQHFGDDAEYEREIERYVRPDLGLCLLEQTKVPEAFEVLDSLVPDPDDESDTRKPSAEVVENWCRSVCGWVTGSADEIVEVPGVGGADNFEKALTYWLRLESREDKWTCAWYRLTFGRTYCSYQWSKLDSSKSSSAKARIEELRQFLEDPGLGPIAEECGDEVLRKRFLWLWDKVK